MNVIKIRERGNIPSFTFYNKQYYKIINLLEERYNDYTELLVQVHSTYVKQ